VSVEKASGSNTFSIPSTQDECTGANVGAGESCTFRVIFTAPTNSDPRNATIEVTGTGSPVQTATVHGKGVPFAAKVDGYITSAFTSTAYVGQGLFCSTPCQDQTVRKTLQKGKTWIYRVKIQNLGNGKDSINVKLSQGESKAIIESITVLRDGNVNVTSQFLNAGYVIRNLNPGSYGYFWVKVKLKANAKSGNINAIYITGQSDRRPTVKDVVRAKTRVQ